MKTTRGTVLAATALAAAASFGNYVVNRKSAGPYNLADVNFWGGAYPTETIEFQESRGPFWALSNVTLPALYNNWGTTVINFDPERPGVITLNGNLGTNTGSYQLNGCIIDFQGLYGFNTNQGWNDWVMRGGTMDLDGCILTNMNQVILLNNGNSGNLLPKYLMHNNARVYCNGVFQIAFYGAPARGLTFPMESGAQVVAGYFLSDGGYQNASTADHHLTLTGAGTKFTSKGTSDNVIGYNAAGATVTVDDQAAVDFSVRTTSLGLQPGSICNRLTVKNRATASFNILYMGMNGGGSNTIEVLDEATVTAWNLHVNGGNASVKGNTLLVSNATLTVNSLYNLNDKGSDSTIHVSGDHPQIVVTGSNGNAIESFNGTTYLFDIPADGYAAGTVPIRVTGVSVNGGQPAGIALYGDSLLRFRFTGVEALQRQMYRKRLGRVRIPLLTATGGVVLAQGVLDDANANLPEGSRLFVATVDGLGTLLLEVKVRLSTQILLR